jgi:hypothetical protein
MRRDEDIGGLISVRALIGAVALAWLAVILQPSTARAQHGDYLLGTSSFFGGAAQAPEGFYYQNLWSYYHASGSGFTDTGTLKCGPLDRVCLSLNLGGSGNLDLFVDQNIFGWTSPYKILGASYGLLVDIPFVYADASGTASLEPILSFNPQRARLIGSGLGGSVSTTLTSSGESTKGSIGTIYLEPINLGWHFKQIDATISSGVFMPSGGYNPSAVLNTGLGNAAGMFGAGGVFYPDEERTWSLSIYAHYLLYGSQIGRPYTLGDEIPFEWAAGKALNLSNDILKQLTLGAVGYAQWQVRNNNINLNPTSAFGISALNTLEGTHSQIYSAGPAIMALTKYGLFSIRYFEEFGSKASPSGRQLMFSFGI